MEPSGSVCPIQSKGCTPSVSSIGHDDGGSDEGAEEVMPTSLHSLCLDGRVGVELGGKIGPDNNNGSSLGLGGGMGALRSITGSSFLMDGAGMSTLSSFFPFTVLCFVFVLRFEDFEMEGVIMTSLGGVKVSEGGS